LLCTLRRGRCLPQRNTHYQAGATPYLGRTFAGWISPASWRTSVLIWGRGTHRALIIGIIMLVTIGYDSPVWAISRIVKTEISTMSGSECVSIDDRPKDVNPVLVVFYGINLRSRKNLGHLHADSGSALAGIRRDDAYIIFSQVGSNVKIYPTHVPESATNVYDGFVSGCRPIVSYRYRNFHGCPNFRQLEMPMWTKEHIGPELTFCGIFCGDPLIVRVVSRESSSYRSYNDKEKYRIFERVFTFTIGAAFVTIGCWLGIFTARRHGSVLLFFRCGLTVLGQRWVDTGRFLPIWNVRYCAGFRTPAMTKPATRWGGRRLKSAKARNRGR
jgi:hypothetical protein